MAGQGDLSQLLQALDPRLHPDRYSFTDTEDPTLGDGDFAIVREAEGLTLIRPDPGGDWARISLGVHSGLEVVGLTATLSARLADDAISANIVAAFHLCALGPQGRGACLSGLRINLSVGRNVIA